MNRIVLIISLLLVISLAGCSQKADRVFQPISQNPEYAVVIKTQTPNKIVGSVVLQSNQLIQIVDEINSSHKLIELPFYFSNHFFHLRLPISSKSRLLQGSLKGTALCTISKQE